ncbi:LAFE_0G18668g1_1 [Lachancea fermentati]|uniref:tRNA wybutosine-synthesizing protein 4 n=1 Tax=Lachancea fermentati TaxID=4955 RepID=A0A1G4MIZ8_LACFM|nr:LAFE_0G18668g1_1 [Lachancea fermentati]
MKSAMKLNKNQIKQVEKHERQKKYSDLAIQNTNNSSIASKASVERLYQDVLGAHETDITVNKSKQYFKYFVPKPIRRSPCINRGYWLRLHAVKSRIDSILGSSDTKVTIVNLGCGYDPLPFQLLDKESTHRLRNIGTVSFVDIDYPELIKNKVTIIEKTPELKSIVGETKMTSNPRTLFNSENYVAVSCDLNEIQSFEEVLSFLNLKEPDVIKIFVAEVSLAYMTAEKADNIITHCANIPNSHFVILEQLLPVGPFESFSKQMMRHFLSNDSPLLSVKKYPSIESQINRFNRLGFPHVNAGDMAHLWNSVSYEIKKELEKIEAFDELEEFFLFCHHYVLVHATNDEEFLFDQIYKFPNVKSYPKNPLLKMSMRVANFEEDLSLCRKFGSSAKLPGNEILYSHGCFNNRLKDTMVFTTSGKYANTLSDTVCPKERMCHSITCLNDELCVLIGGRGGPNKPLHDSWLLKKTEGAWRWTQGPNLPEPRFRHQACALNSHQLLIFGGVTQGPIFLLYDSETGEFSEPRVIGEIPRKVSSSLCFDQESQTGVISGGSSAAYSVDDDMIVFCFDEASKTVEVQSTYQNLLFMRYGSKSVFLDKDHVLVVGGMSPELLFGQTTTIIEVDITNGDVSQVEIPSQVWEQNAPMLAGFELQKLETGDVLVFGGGAVCYGFGSVWNKPLLIGENNIDLSVVSI